MSLNDSPVPQWRERVKERLDHLCALEKGWDGYQAPPVAFTSAYFALSMLDAICDSDVPAPGIVPGSDGDLQVEWHLHSGDIELHVVAPNVVRAWRCTAETHEDGEEISLQNDFTLVASWIRALVAERRRMAEANAAITAAA